MKFFFLLIIFSTLLPQPSLAKEGQEIIFDRYILKNTTYTSQLQLKAKRIFQETFPDCVEKLAYVRLKPTIIVPANFTVSDDPEDIQNLDFNDLHPSFGQWVEHARINGCDEKTTINILATANDAQLVPVLFPLVNGTTKVEIKHQSIAEKNVSDAVATNTDCSDPGIVLGTEIIGYLAPGGNRLAETDQQAGWFEKWVIEACAKEYTVNLAALPDPRTQYRYIAEFKTESDDTKEETADN